MQQVLFLILLSCATNLCAQSLRTENIHLGDPFALRVDSTYYLYGTRSDRGFQVYASQDLVRWDSLGYAYTRPQDSWGRRNFWAPEVFAHRGKYYLTYSANGPADTSGFKLCLAVADHPAGPFTDLKTPWLAWPGWKCIDAHLFLDEDGQPYLYFNRVGIRGEEKQLYGIIYVVRLSDDLLRATGPPREVVRAQQPWEAADPAFNSNCNEGAFVFKQDSAYYLTYSSGHYKSPLYAIGVATAPHPLGPWTKAADNPLLASDLAVGRSGPGHASVTTSLDGRRRFLVYHVHADPEQPGADRVVNIRELEVVDGKWLRLE